MTVYLPVPSSVALHAALQTTKVIAVVVTRPSTHESIQFKGNVRAIRIAGESERSVVDAYLDGFVGELETVGLPRRLSRRVVTWPAYGVDCDLEAVFEQTPGPLAGDPLSEARP